MPEFRKGDKVRVAYEGVVDHVSSNGQTLSVSRDGHMLTLFVYAEELHAFELVERAAPEWWPLKAADVVGWDEEDSAEIGLVVSDDGLPLRIQWSLGGYSDAASYPPRSGLRLLFRDGKPYPQDGAR